ncbi:Pls/PosA family non-ribosomal peptide synthetase [Corynebacterium bovis]|uniref:Pls/PosA family non-ribosomal peptide synthetase n=2 Tax=Corynebacterium bovis TaxID=36808 RepID=UPI000F652EFB|nr:Pls/PosA family non-ribosomal peptide synthetase [Corynebacterium bovis]RRQ14934.1 amino acid adenylation protein [Corynebacterium bovis]
MTVPPQYLRSAAAPAPRALVDVLRATAARWPDAAAVDDGRGVLSYAELVAEVEDGARRLAALGVRRGDRVGVRMPSGDRALYTAILSVLAAGAAYVPVDADDPEERAELVFGEAGIVVLHGPDGPVRTDGTPPPDTDPDTAPEPDGPTPDSDAWIIFTSGSTGRPKGVAVTHRSAAAFVDAEADLFCRDEPLGPDDRVLAGLSVAFDASCEEMWLAWRHGACLVPAPRALVRSGVDLGPWLISRGVTVVSTVPTLAGLWPDEALDAVRLLIFGGEACPPELAARLATPDRELWNTYGPTEATVVACAAPMDGVSPVSIGLPLAGWDLAVVDADGAPVPVGGTGELVIGGVGLARYLDPEKDAEKYAPAPTLGWERAYRSGDHVRLEEDGLYFVGRVDDQVKIGGRRIELGEVDAACSAVPGVRSSAVVVRTTGGGDRVLVAYVSGDVTPDDARAHLRDSLPAAMVPRVCVLDELPVTTSGKVDRKALPWPLPAQGPAGDGFSTPTEEWLGRLWSESLGTEVADADADFFSLGGTSLGAATLVARVREVAPTVSVRDLYDRSRLGAFAAFVDDHTTGAAEDTPLPRPVGARTRLLQALIQVPAMTLVGARWLTWLLVADAVLGVGGVPWWLALAAVVVVVTPLGRLPLSAAAVRLVTRGVTAGDHPRGGSVHLRLWAAERIADTSGARGLAGATWITTYARWLGADVGRGVQLHTLPPVTGMLTLGDHCSVEQEVDLRGYWVDGDVVHVGPVSVGPGATVGARSTLLPGTRIGRDAHVEAGSCVTGDRKVKARSRWAGSPAAKVGRARHRFPDQAPPRRRHWVAVYGVSSVVLDLLPLVALLVGAAADLAATTALTGTPLSGADAGWVLTAVLLGAPAGLVVFAAYTALTWLLVRLLSLGLRPGVWPVRSHRGWRVWAVERLMDAARTHLFPLYAAQLTPAWFRSLGATVGRDAEISTAVMVPRFTEVRDGAFLADDTMVGGYELGGGGWLLTGPTRVGKRSFLGNSGIAAPQRTLKKNSLVAVLSSTPRKAKAGSNWLDSPPERLRRVEVDTGGSDERTYRPSFRLKAARGVVETLRLTAPMTSALIAAAVLAGLQWLLVAAGGGLGGAAVALVLSGPVLAAAGAVAAVVTVAVKWLCVGRIRAGDHLLWSGFVWVNELQDQFVETVAGPWFLSHTSGTASLSVFLRALGARIGRGAWIESYWLPEADLCEIGRGATVGPGCVVQTHLFQDRVMSLDRVTVGDGATLGPHSVALPASSLGAGTTVGPASLVMRGDRLPAHTRWQGNPVETVAD